MPLHLQSSQQGQIQIETSLQWASNIQITGMKKGECDGFHRPECQNVAESHVALSLIIRNRRKML
jgi:hypothetical protein